MLSKVYNRDCLEAMREMPDKAFDLCLTDPPYGVLSEKWDAFNNQEYTAFTMRWLGHVRSFGCPLVTFAGERTRKYITPLLEALYDNVRQLIWDKGSGGVADEGFFYCFESIYVCYPDSEGWEVVKPKVNRVGEMIRQYRLAKDLSRSGVDIAIRGKKTGLCFRWEEGACLPTPEQAERLKHLLGMDGEFSSALEQSYAERDEIKELARIETTKRAAFSQDIVRFHAISTTGHPCEKPVDLLKHILKSLPQKPNCILDPFLGSGSSRIAAYDLGFDFIGYELDTDYYNAQEERFRRHIAQGKLFDPMPVRTHQDALFQGEI